MPRPEIYLNLDAAHRGVGTLSCGPDTLARYRLLEPAYHFTYSLSALAQGDRRGAERPAVGDPAGRRKDE